MYKRETTRLIEHFRRAASVLRLVCACLTIGVASVAGVGSAQAQDCTLYFPEGLQSHDAAGSIDFQLVAQLFDNPDAVLEAPQVTVAAGLTSPSCAAQGVECEASGQASAASLLPSFQTSQSAASFVVSASSSGTIGDLGDFEFLDVEARASSILNFDPAQPVYVIKTLTARHASTIRLSPGDYWIEAFDMGFQSTLEVTGSGTARVHILGNVPLAAQVKLNVATDVVVSDASRLVILAYDGFGLGVDSEVAAIVYAAGSVELDLNAKLAGAINAQSVFLRAGSQVHYRAAAVTAADLGGFCAQSFVDLDGDGIPDDLDPDRDGDGISNIFEEELGSDPDDPNETPADADSNGIPDILEGIPGDAACLEDIFDDGLASHGELVAIDFGKSAVLRGSPDGVLQTEAVKTSGGSPLPSCETQNADCVAFGIAAASLTLEPFRTSASTSNRTIATATYETLGEDGTNEYRDVRLKAGATAEFVANYPRYVMGLLWTGHASTVIFAPGDYWIDDMHLGVATTFIVSGEGTARVFVNGGITVASASQLNVNEPIPDAGRLLIVTRKHYVQNFAAQVAALIYAVLDGTIGTSADLYGALGARSIKLRPFSSVEYDPTALDTVVGGTVCGSPIPTEQDRDGDGVTDVFDWYPDDPERYTFGQVSGLAVVGIDDFVRVSWQMPEHGTAPFTYNVYRAPFGTQSFARVNLAPIVAETFDDTTVVNGAAYVYVVRAVNANAEERPEGTDRSIFVAYAPDPVANLTAVREGAFGRISFDPPAVPASVLAEYTILRALQGGTPVLLATTTAATYIDTTVASVPSYDYQVAIRWTFTNPIDGAVFSLDGPLSAIATLPPGVQIELAIDDLQNVGAVVGRYARQDGFLTITGSYSGITDADVSLAYAGATQSQTRSDGLFSFTIQTTLESTVTITVALAGNPASSESASFEIIFDLEAPVVTEILAPLPAALVNGLETIDVRFTEVGLGIDSAATAVSVNGAAETVGCTTPTADRVVCTLTTPPTDEAMSWSLVLADLAGNTAAPATGDVSQDTDLDGVPESEDAYPVDPTRSVIDPVPGVTVAPNPADGGRSVAVSWLDYPDTPVLTGYRVYRRVFGGTFGFLVSVGPAARGHVDVTVANGETYEYQVAGVGPSDLEGDRGAPLAILVAYNDQTVANFVAVRVPVDVSVTWGDSGGLPVRVFRAPAGGVLAPVATQTGGSYLDSSASFGAAFEYAGASVRTFQNLATSAIIEVEGPITANVLVPALPPFALDRVDDAVQTADPAVWEIVRPATANITLTGSFSGAISDVQLQVAWGGQTVTAGALASNGGRFSVTLANDPAVTSDATLTLSEALLPVRAVSATLRFGADTEGPIITLDGPASFATDEDFAIVTGTVVDLLSGVASVEATNDRFPGQAFEVTQGANDTIRLDVPLLTGANVVTILAVDGVGNGSGASIEIDRTIDLTPVLEITSPAEGSTFTTSPITVEGRVLSALASEELRLSFLDRVDFPTPDPVAPGVHLFSFSGVHLARGLNVLQVRVESVAGDASADVPVTFDDGSVAPGGGGQEGPSIEITSPRFDSHVNEDTATVTGKVSSPNGVTSLTINGQSVTLTCETPVSCTFEFSVDLLTGDGPLTIELTDGAGEVIGQTLSITRDVTPPVITLVSPVLTPPPAVNTLTQQVLTLTGTVADANLSSLLFNGQQVSLTPGVSAGLFDFEITAALPLQQDLAITFDAADLAGNPSRLEFVVRSEFSVDVEIIAPEDGAEFAIDSAGGVALELLAQLNGIGATDTVEVQFDSAPAEAVVHQGGVLRGTLAAAASVGTHTLTVRVRDDLGVVSGERTQSYSVFDPAAIELALDRHEPENGSVGAEPNGFIALFFNKPIDPALLDVEVRETLSGFTYVFPDEGGEPFFNQTGAVLQEVNRVAEPVPGGLAIVPGGNTVTFEPARDIGYDAQVFVDVVYNGAVLGRFIYRVRPLPTVAHGKVVDNFHVDVEGVAVSIPALGLETVTDENGVYSFGLGLAPDQTLAGGVYELRVNDGFARASHGTELRTVNIQQGRVTRLVTVTLPQLNVQVPFQRLSGGDPDAALALGEVELDLTDAALLFPNGRSAGDVHMQFLRIEQSGVAAIPGALPSFLYSLQPRGIEVFGVVGVEITMPQLFGSHDYLQAVGGYVLLVGRSARSDRLEPVGIGQIVGTQVQSIEPVALERLDYLGVAFVAEDLQEAVTEFANTPSGDRSLEALIATIITRSP